jgi:hypothetical protein
VNKTEIIETYYLILYRLYELKVISKKVKDKTIEEKVKDLIDIVNGKIRILSEIMI